MTATPAPRSPFLAGLQKFAALWGFLLFILVVMVVFRSVMLPFALGMLAAYILAPVVRRLSSVQLGRQRLPRGIAVIIVYLGLAGAMTLFFTILVPRLSSELARLLRETPQFFDRLRHDYVPRADAWLDKTFPAESHWEEPAPRPERKLTASETRPGRYDISLENFELELVPRDSGRYVIRPRPDYYERRTRLSDLLGHAARTTETEVKDVLLVGRRFLGSIFKFIAWFILTFMVAAYLLVDSDRIMIFLRSLVPPAQQRDCDELVLEIDRGLSGVIRGQLIICVVNAFLTTIGLLLFHVKYALLLGLLAGAMSFIPVFGSILSSLPIVTVALTSGTGLFSLSRGLSVLAWIVGIHLLEANALNPKIIGRAAKMHPGGGGVRPDGG